MRGRCGENSSVASLEYEYEIHGDDRRPTFFRLIVVNACPRQGLGSAAVVSRPMREV